MQYNETDWAFSKRLASHFHTVLAADSYTEKPMYTFGVPEPGKTHVIDTNAYSVMKDMDRDGEATFFLIKRREIFRLGERVTLNDKALTIYSIETNLEGSELYHTYHLTAATGFSSKEIFNEDLIGLSLNARVTAVQRASVQVSIQGDENSAHTGARWFPYSTPYSTPDGTGWYCMPEAGDEVRLYFSCEKESMAYVSSSVHLDSAAGDERVNPDFKSIMNKQKKEVLFTPGSLLLTNNAGMSIELSDAEGIKIVSDKAISIQSKKSVNITSATDKLEIQAPESIVLEQGGTQMMLQDKMFFKGAQLRLD